MGKRIICFLVLLIFLGSVFIGNNIILANSQEIIHNFESNILVKEDSSVEIQETIVYDFGRDLLKHGIIRYIPFRYSLEDKVLVIDYEVLSVKEEGKNYIKYSVYEEGDNFVIKIGSQNELVSGQRTYIIKYLLKGVINYFDDHDELFWNVTGNNWQVPIKNSATYFALDNFFDELSVDDFQAVCYTGFLGSKESNCRIDKTLSARVISFEASDLKPRQGLTIVAAWPKGFTPEIEKQYIEKTKTKEITIPIYASSGEITLFGKFLLLLQYILFLVPFVVFIFLFNLWWKKGRNPRPLKSIMAEYEAPADISPAEAHIILTEGSIDLSRMATATLIHLARRGYFIIKEEKKKVLFFKKTDWKFIKIDKQKPEDFLNKYEKYLLDSIFEDKNEVFLTTLKKTSSDSKQDKMKQELKEAKVSLGESLTNKNLLPENPFDLIQKLKYWKITVIIPFLIISLFVNVKLLGAGQFDFGYISTLGGFFAILIIFSIFIKIMPSLTEKGMEMKEKLKGFELFLKMVEKDRVKFHFSPQAHPEKFAEYLPYAILFGVEKQWAKLFKDINAAIPEWYQGTQGANMNTIIIASSIMGMHSNINSSFFASGYVAASGSSGFGSGGSVGGGFGGGGGGSW